jgi:hypothetical protein
LCSQASTSRLDLGSLAWINPTLLKFKLSCFYQIGHSAHDSSKLPLPPLRDLSEGFSLCEQLQSFFRGRGLPRKCSDSACPAVKIR